MEVGARSEPASFTTPFTAPGEEVVATMEQISQMILMVLEDYPQLAEFQDKVLTSISDESGPLTPSGFLELFETYKIVKVSER